MDPFPDDGVHGEVIDLASDSDDNFQDFVDFDSDDDAGVNDMLANGPENAIDLTGLEDIPDIDIPPSSPNTAAQFVDLEGDVEVVGEAECLQMVLDVLPDIAVEHVLNLIQEQERTLQPRTFSVCERLITKILDGGTYPKEHDEVNKRKRKREDDGGDEITKFEKGEQDTDVHGYYNNALNLLKDEFLFLPVRHIENTLQEHKTLFKTYGILERQLQNYNRISSPFSRLNRSRNKRGTEWVLIEAGDPLPKELKAAKKRSEMEAEKRRKEKEAERAEEDNIARAQANGEMGECLCCFGDFPRNRMTCCNGDTIHFFCMTCAKTYVEGEIGKAKCRPVCFADTSCGGTFTRHQLLEFLGQASFDRLEHLQQQAELAAAGLDFLSECPFCDFKAELPPIEIDREFRCQNPKCEKTSCRLCEKETHIPLTCEEAKKDGTLTIRHVIEEAMSAALIRKCNNCRHAFVKEHGCNKMVCSKCSNMQCYVCSKTIRDYNHFGNAAQQRDGSKCPLHDNVEARHEEEVKKAAADAMSKVRAEHPNISEEELMVQVSDRVKQAEQARRGRADVDHQQFPFHMQGAQLVAGPAGAAGAIPAPEAGPGLHQPQPGIGRFARMQALPVPRRLRAPVPIVAPVLPQIQPAPFQNPFEMDQPQQPQGGGFRFIPAPVLNRLPFRAPVAAGPDPAAGHPLGGELANDYRRMQERLGLNAPPGHQPPAAQQQQHANQRENRRAQLQRHQEALQQARQALHQQQQAARQQMDQMRQQQQDAFHERLQRRLSQEMNEIHARREALQRGQRGQRGLGG